MNPSLQRLSWGLLTAYLALFANLVFTALSVPMALHFLGKEIFGLWVLAQQISGYLSLLDLGLLAAYSRLIAEHKEDVNKPGYGGLLRTAWFIFGALGVLIAVLGVIFAFFAGKILNVPDALQSTCFHLLVILSISAAFSLWSKAAAIPLWAFHRMDLINGSVIFSHVTGLCALLLGFFLGLGVYSMAFAVIPGILGTAWIGFTGCRRGGYYPSRGKWVSPSLAQLKKGVLLGKDIFLISVGTQMANASQLVLLARFAGLQEAAVFSIATKALLLSQQVCAKVIQNSISKLTEFFVHGQIDKYSQRTFHLAVISTFLACFFGTGIIFFNSSMVSIWTGGRIVLGFGENVALGLLLFFTVFMLVILESFIAQANIMRIRWARIGEGCAIVLISVCFHQHLSTVFLLGVTLFAATLSFCFCVFRLFSCIPPLKGLFSALIFKGLVVLVAASFSAFVFDSLLPGASLAFTMVTYTILIVLAYFWIIPRSFRQELYRAGRSLSETLLPLQKRSCSL